MITYFKYINYNYLENYHNTYQIKAYKIIFSECFMKMYQNNV